MSRPTRFAARVEPVTNALVLVGVAAAVLGLLVVRAPGWGLMDDAANLNIAARFSAEGGGFRAFWALSVADMRGWGMLRPIYWLWVLTAYSVFADSPLGAYLANATLVLAGVLMWGLAFDALFTRHGVARSRALLLYPTLLLVFPPFWSLFMYLSLQEKFVVLLAAAASLAYARSLGPTRETLWMIAGWGSILLGVLSKPTMVTLPLAIIGVSLLGMMSGGQRHRHRAWVVTSVLFVAGYAWFTLAFQGGSYTSSYGEGFSGSGLLEGLRTAPLTVQILGALGLLAVALLIAMPFPSAERSIDPAVLLPMSLLAHLAVLLPWGFQTYLLSAIAPFVAGSLLIVAHQFQRHIRVLGRGAIVIPGVAGLLALMFVLDISPKSLWLSDTREMQSAVVAAQAGAVFYLPPPFIEHAVSLRALTSADVRYLSSAELAPEDVDGDVLLIAYLDQSRILLRGVGLGEPIHESDSWKVIPLFPEPDQVTEFGGDFASSSVPLGRRIRMLLTR